MIYTHEIRDETTFYMYSMYRSRPFGIYIDSSQVFYKYPLIVSNVTGVLCLYIIRQQLKIEKKMKRKFTVKIS